jgi:DNA-binding MarR family transcriptional regulator
MPAADPVDALVSQWAGVRPDLRERLPAMATFAKLGRLAIVGGRAIEGVFREHGLVTGEFDVLAALRRSGEPYAVPPSRLARALMLSPAGMTNRVDRLEAAGYVERRPDPEDRRSTRVVITAAGLELVDRVVELHLENEEALLGVLSADERRSLDRSLDKLLAQFAR